MPRTCVICRHPARDQIDQSLVAGAPYRSLASQYGTSITSLYRHKESHLPAALVKAEEAEEIARADDLVEQLKALRTQTRIVWEAAEHAGDRKAMLGSIREERANIELLARITGQFDGRPPQEHEHWHLHAAVYAEPLEIRKFFVSNNRWPTVEERRFLLDEAPNGDSKH